MVAKQHVSTSAERMKGRIGELEEEVRGLTEENQALKNELERVRDAATVEVRALKAAAAKREEEVAKKEKATTMSDAEKTEIAALRQDKAERDWRKAHGHPY